ncbi:putative DNA binding domain-containing protein [Candidatus Desantisbacteria bacterium]|nr:putative DNA binding domain-containing protein [Candidatus Desantisbacteria bacterium]
METKELLKFINKGEDSKTQFKSNINNSEQLAQEMTAFSNAKGGIIIVGVNDDSNIVGLSSEDIRRLNQLISNTANEKVKPPITPCTEIISIENKKILTININEGINKPYCTNEGIYFTKVGADKRKISQEELLRLFQESNKLYADEKIISSSTLNDIDDKLFESFYKKQYEEDLKETELSLKKILENLGLAEGEKLNLAGLMLFGKNPQKLLPAFIIKAVSFVGNDPAGTTFRDSEDIHGNLSELYKNGIAFLLRNLKKIQISNNFNEPGELEIPKIVLEEILVNALIHRDYFINAPVKIFIFDNKIEIENPGKLPNNLTIENIKNGVSNIRNPVLTSFASKILPYRGVGTGIIRAIKNYKQIEFINNVEVERFKVIINRRQNGPN